MIAYIRWLKKNISLQYSVKRAYLNDCMEYSRWQYNNPKVKTKNALEAKILRQSHIIEKGMSLSNPKAKFGVQKAYELIDFIEEFARCGFNISNSTPVRHSIGILGAYIEFHKKQGFILDEIMSIYEKIKKYLPEEKQEYGVISIKKLDLESNIHSEYPDFFSSRHSVRQFADIPVLKEDIKKAVNLAMQAPSACNRQSCKVYFYEDKEINSKLGELIAGNNGFDSEVQNYLVVTSDMSAFYDAFERNQVYVDGGIFALALTEAMHYYGIASCILQNGEFARRNVEFKKVCGNILECEKIILFIAIGYYKDEFTYATSNRKQLKDVLIIH